jgi:hypothetical protein
MPPAKVPNRVAHGPDIGVMMTAPSITIIEGFCCDSAGFSYSANMVKQRTMHFRQVADFGRPVIHFSIDIGGVFAFPGRFNILVPDSL